MSNIPKIIHQIWIGDKPPPTKFMDSWKNKHEPEGFEYIRWTEQELMKRGFTSQLQDKVDSMEEINGKADILRWEILYEYGGFFTDADAYCLESISYLLNTYKAFAGYENEKVRNAGWCKNNQYDDVLARTHPLIATGTMAFPPKHELPKLAIEWIKNNEISVQKTMLRAWRTVGPGLLTRLYWSKKWDDITILPSYYFLPIHCSGVKYEGHDKIYAYQEWGSTKQNYETMNDINIPNEYFPSKDKISILISSYNTKAQYISECLRSITNQIGNLQFEVVWINDGSDELHTKILKRLLEKFQNNTRFTNVIYNENEGNKGLGYTFNKGNNLCNNEIIMRMDSDDIMFPERIQTQFNFMNKNKDIAICGSQVLMFRDNINNIVNKTNHKTITWDEYKQNISHWFINHPTVCYRKSKVLEAGNYNPDIKVMIEDFDLVLRMLKKYNIVYNIQTPLLYYRLHDKQITNNISNEWREKKNKLIYDLINK
tara:strand:+ start:4520 stop:5974 length:1455 start_codon:yes stop_codon:yes gene_type:complete